MKKLILTTLSILIIGLILTNISCEKLEIERVTKIQTGEVSDIGYYTTTIQGTIIDMSEDVREIGHCWDTLSSPETNKDKLAMSDPLNQGSGIHTEMTNLKPGHKYYVRAYAFTDKETIYGTETIFETTKLPNYLLTFSFPATGSLWPIGKSRKIIWTTDIPGAFKLTLLKFEGGSDVDLREIATTADGAREFDYVLPSDAVTAGDFYAIRIESIEIHDTYSLQGFKATDPAISMVQPNANTKWNINREYTIEWNSTDIDRVDIKLYQNGNWVSDIADDKINNNIQPWSVAQSLTPGTNYQIKINYFDFPEIIATSENFEILGEEGISVTAPIATDDWQMGSTHNITWTDNIAENVRIELYKDGTFSTEIAGDIPSTSPYSWTIPAGMTAASDYTIKVTMIGNDNIVDDSDEFTISEATAGGLVAYYPFNGNANDESGNNHDGTVDGATLTTDRFGNANSAFSFDGVDDYIDIGSISPLDNPVDKQVSISLWARGNINNFTKFIEFGTASSGNGLGVGIGAGSVNSIDFRARTTDHTFNPSSISITNEGDWHHYVLTLNDISGTEILKGYIDGDEFISFTAQSNSGSGSSSGYIGKKPSGYYFNGAIDDIRIYDYALTESEINNLYTEGGWQGYETGTVTDKDDNAYNTVKIGNQWWMAENLKVTQYESGTAIDEITDNTTWANLGDNNTDKAFCYYNNNASGEADTYGALYTWAAAMDGNASSTANPSGIQGVCPTGWHLPSDAEWKELEMQLGMSQADADASGNRGTDEGGKIKETGFAHWNSPNTGATNESGFTALAGGIRRHDNGSFVNFGDYGTWWMTTENSGVNAWYRSLGHDYAVVYRDHYNKSFGFSVRCVKD